MILKINEERLSEFTVYTQDTKKQMKICAGEDGETLYGIAEGLTLARYEIQPHNFVS